MTGMDSAEADYRYIRMGWFDQDRNCDKLVRAAVTTCPGELMPTYWRSCVNNVDFIQQYGPGVKWCKTASYHLLIINGWPILRIWTNAKTRTLLEVNNHIAKLLEVEGFVFTAIPEGTRRRRKEFSLRTHVTLVEEIKLLLTLVGNVYGLENA